MPAELESTGVIYVPCFHKQSGLKPAELDKILFDVIPAIGDYAKKVGSRILLEPLNKKETFYINRLEQAAAICNKLNNEGTNPEVEVPQAVDYLRKQWDETYSAT
jgi:hydroxypyruvate isomerase